MRRGQSTASVSTTYSAVVMSQTKPVYLYSLAFVIMQKPQNIYYISGMLSMLVIVCDDQ